MTATRFEPYTLAHRSDLYITDCCTCGVVFGIPETLKARRLADGKDFYCPNGHPMVFQDTDAAKIRRLRESLTWERQRLDQERARADHMAAVARGHKGAHQRTKNRIAKGVCPCCNRAFLDLGRHMAGQHPDYTGDSQ